MTSIYKVKLFIFTLLWGFQIWPGQKVQVHTSSIDQGILTEGEGSVQLTSCPSELILLKSLKSFLCKVTF
jgi:hypothetical protein